MSYRVLSILLLFMVAFSTSAGAVEETTNTDIFDPFGRSAVQDETVKPSGMPLDEYKNVPPGLLLETKTGAIVKDDEKEGTALEGQNITSETVKRLNMEEILIAYKKKDYKTAVEHIVPLAEKNFSAAQELLGIMYIAGQGVEKNKKKGIEWLTKAAEDGRALAQHHLGVIYFAGGDDVSRDPIKSLMWLHIAIVHYNDGPEKKRAQQDRDNLYVRLSRRDKDRALYMAREWLEKRGSGRLMDMMQ